MRHYLTRPLKAGVCVSSGLALLLPHGLSSEGFPEYKARATFIYHLTDNVEWSNSPVKLCTYGYDAATQHLEKLSQLPDNKVKILRNIGLEEVSQCNILYISKSGSRLLPEIITESKKSQILTISDIENFTIVGGMMSFEIVRNRVKLKANKRTIKDAGIRLSPSLLNILERESH